MIGVSGLLALTAWFLTRGGGDARGGLLVGVAPSRLVSLEVEDSSGFVRVWRHASGRWLHEAGGFVWAADEGRVRAGLRLACDAVMEGGGEAVGEGGVTVRFGMDDGEMVGVRLADVAVGGRVRASRDGSSGSVDADLGRVLSVEGVSAWRSPEMMPWLDARVKRVLGERAGERVVVSRVGERWALESPIACAADEASVLQWLGRLRSGAEGEGRAIVEGAGESEVEAWLVNGLVEGLDSSVQSGVEMRDGVLLGPVEFLGKGVAVPSVEELVSRVSVRSEPTIVARIEVGGQRAERGEIGWDRAWAPALLGLLNGREADERSLADTSGDMAGAAFSLFGFGGVPLESGEIACDGDDLIVWTDGVERRYAGACAGELTGLIDSAGG